MEQIEKIDRNSLPGKPDRRVERTKMMLSDALIELILEKGYDKVSVQNIVDHANVGRTTFYAHFADKDALLTFGLAELEAMMQNVNEIDAILSLLLTHATEEPRLFHAFLSTQTLRDKMTRWFANTLQSRGHTRSEAEARFIAGGIIALLRWWQLEQPQHSLDDVMQVINTHLASAKPD